MPDEIELRPADPSWQEAFAQAAEELTTVLGASARVEHVGSTAVPGLAAKPVIDVLVGVAQAEEVSDAARSLIELGFAPGEGRDPERPTVFLSRPSRGDEPSINIHLTVIESRQWRDLICFRAALEIDRRLSQRYEALKRRLAATSGGDLDVYTAGKTAFVAEVLESAYG